MSTAQRAAFERDGSVHLPGVLTEDGVDEIAEVCDRFLRRDIAVDGLHAGD